MYYATCRMHHVLIWIGPPPTVLLMLTTVIFFADVTLLVLTEHGHGQ
jgi:hypothetical protein